MTGRAISPRIASAAPISARRAPPRPITATRPPPPRTCPPTRPSALFRQIVTGNWTPADAELFRAQMLTELAAMSVEDGMVMQIHPGSCRNHNHRLFESHGRDKGADIPTRTDYVHALKPLLDRFGTETRLSIILFTLDESTYARELAPLAGHYPCLKLGPAWWFHDSPEGMRRFREMTTETAGFYNTVGFNDDTRAFLSIPARHDVARRVDCAFLARLVAEHRLADWEAAELAHRTGLWPRQEGLQARRPRIFPGCRGSLNRSPNGVDDVRPYLLRHPSRHDGVRLQRGAARSLPDRRACSATGEMRAQLHPCRPLRDRRRAGRAARR